MCGTMANYFEGGLKYELDEHLDDTFWNHAVPWSEYGLLDCNACRDIDCYRDECCILEDKTQKR